MPPPLTFPDGKSWRIGTPDLIVVSPPVEMKAQPPDWFGSIGQVADGPDRGSVRRRRRSQRGQRLRAAKRPQQHGRRALPVSPCRVCRRCAGRGATPTLFPVHEVGRNADVFDEHGRQAPAGQCDDPVQLGASPRERNRHEGAPRGRLQVPSRGIQADAELPAAVRRQRTGPGHQGRWRPISASTPTSRFRST